jgi:hypothetical protein
MPTSMVMQCEGVLLPVLTKIINMSLDSGSFPDEWKIADVHPQLKKSKLETVFENLRPINNLSYVSRLTDHAVFDQTNNFFNIHRLYP